MTTNSWIESLSQEVILNIFKHLDYISLCRISQSCKKFRVISGDEGLWKQLCYRNDDLNLYSISNSTSINTNNNTSSSSSNYNNNDKIKQFDWRNTIKSTVQLNNNWKNGKYKMKILEGHTKTVKNIQMNDKYIISGSADKTVRVWNSLNGDCVRTFVGPNSVVLSIDLTGNEAIIGYRNGTIKKVDINTGDDIWEKQFSFHSEGFHYMDNRLISWDSAISIWNAETGIRLSCMSEHSKKVLCVEVDSFSNYLVSGSADKTVKRFDITKSLVTNTFKNHTSSVNCIGINYSNSNNNNNQNIIVSGGNDKYIYVHDIRTNQESTLFKGHVCPVRSIVIQGNKIVSGGNDNTVRLWDIRNNSQCVQRFDIHKSPVVNVQIDNSKIVSGSQEGVILLCDFLNQQTQRL